MIAFVILLSIFATMWAYCRGRAAGEREGRNRGYAVGWVSGRISERQQRD